MIRPNEWQSFPWLNGRGTTSQIIIEPAEANFSDLDFDWRLSSAPIFESGNFSRFPDHHRMLTLIEGKGLELQKPDSSIRKLKIGDFFEFSGEEDIFASPVQGPIRDLNFIYKKDFLKPSYSWEPSIPNLKSRQFSSENHHLIYLISGKLNHTTGTVAEAGDTICISPTTDSKYLNWKSEAASFIRISF